MAIFDWFKKSSEITAEEKARETVRRPVSRDWSEDLVPNSDLLKGLYHNTYPGLKLAGSLAFPAVAVPVFFMGLPMPTSDNDDIDVLKFLQNKFITEEQQIHIHCHREGTIWIWPKFNQEKKVPLWEFISDDSVVDIIKDVYTQGVKKIYTDEQLTISTGYNERQIIRRIREFTERDVLVRYEPQISGLHNRRYRNTIGIMPIPFSNNADGNNIRGYSDLGRILSDLKMYHDTELAQHEMIAKFRPKIVQQVLNADDWISQNGLSSDLSDLNVAAIDFILNLSEKEKTEFISLAAVAAPYIDTKKQTFKKIVQGSGVPEICWGLKTEGNNASVQESISSLANFVDDKKRQIQESYNALWTATLKLYRAGSQMQYSNSDVYVTWDQMDTINEKSKAEIFKNFSEGLSKIATDATGTKAQLWKMWRKNYPEITDEDEENFMIGLRDMAEHRQFTTASWEEVQLGMGSEE